jgi:ribonuclease Z
LQKNPKRWYLIDCGEGTQHQLLYSPLAIRHLTGIFITHVHGDHCYGLPGLLASATLHARTEPLLIVAPKTVNEWIQSTLQMSESHLSYEIEYLAIETLKGSVSTADFEVDVIALSHRVPSWAFRFTEQAEAPATKLDHAKLMAEGIAAGAVWGQLQRGENVTIEKGRVLQAQDYLRVIPAKSPQAVIIGGDNDTPELLAKHLQQVQLVVHEATYTQAIADKVGDIPMHSSAKRVAEFAEKYQVPNLILTHFSARYSNDIAPIEDEAQQYYHGRLMIADDFNTFRLEPDNLIYLVQEPEAKVSNVLEYEE